jgi:predicted amidohydrolase YtcJ
LAAVLWLLCTQAFAADPVAADTLIISNNVLPMDQTMAIAAQPGAVAVVGERIAWIGSPEQAQAWIGTETQVVDYGDQAVLPGFIDAHGHLSFSALATTVANVASPPVGPVMNIAQLQDTLGAYIEDKGIANGDWVVGMGYDDSLIAENRHPNRDELDAVSTSHPIFLVHVSGHLIATNSRGLARAGITAETPDPPGGIIRRRPGSQEPDGVLEETATYPLRQFMSAANKEPIASVAQAMRDYASYGITTIQDGAASEEVMTLLSAAAATGALSMDVVAYPVGMAKPESIASAYTFGVYENRLKIGGVKLILDGSPQGKTAFLSAPYHVPPHGLPADYAGYPTIDPVQTATLVAAYLDRNIPIIAHANGDAAAQMLIDAVADADPQHDHRTVMIHAQTVREDQLTAMKNLAMIPSFFSTHTFYWGDWHRDSVLGEERARRISPTASTLQRGMVFTVHNDAPIVPPDMIRLLWATTNRQTRSAKVLGAEQRISTYDALRAMTTHAAYQHFEEADKGSLEAGRLADVVVLSQDPLSLAPEDLLSLEVVATYSRGRQVFSATQAGSAR